MLAYLHLLEADRLQDAQDIDARYHQAKLVAAAFNEPERIWHEHELVRGELLRTQIPSDAQPAPTFEDVVRIHNRMIAVGLVVPSAGVRH